MAFFSTTLPQRRFSGIDVLVLLFVFMLLYAVLHLGAGMNAPFVLEEDLSIDLNPGMLPYYAGRSLLRMFIAFACALVFTLLYGYTAAKSRAAERVLVPLLDMLQSVPVLGFLSATIVAFMSWFPGSLLGVELASIFAIFTGQAWNMTFSFYHSLVTVPKDLQEAAAVLRLNWWQRLIRLEVPFAMIGLVWNSMMSFGGGWFFLAASEAISVLGQNIRLPGVGSYLAAAIEAGNIEAIGYSIVMMVLMIIAVDQLFWRPLIVWSQKFKMELTGSADAPTSFVYQTAQRSRLLKLTGRVLIRPLWRIFSATMDRVAVVSSQTVGNARQTFGERFFDTILQVVCFGAIIWLLHGAAYQGYLLVAQMDIATLIAVVGYGGYTMGRVFLAVLLGAIWTVPVGVWIGLNPRLAKFMQPVVQVAASFPANMLFPFVTMLFLRYQINFEWGSIALMMLGTQWYILFNVIAGTMSIPADLKEAGAIFKVRGWRMWKTLLLPSIFPYLITGVITASGGAWNASIVSELVSWHNQELAATGLGAYISQVTAAGEWGGIIWAITVMCLFVVLINRFVWRRLYRLAEEKYHLD